MAQSQQIALMACRDRKTDVCAIAVTGGITGQRQNVDAIQVHRNTWAEEFYAETRQILNAGYRRL